MSNYFNRQERQEMEELLRIYKNIRSGRSASFIDEDDFERIIDYFDDHDDVPSALEAANVALEYFPFASNLMLRKADFLIANQQYHQALQVLDEVALYDTSDIGLYILRTDAYLALEEHEKAAVELEEALGQFEGEERTELLFELADVYDDYEDFDKVFECLKMILEQDHDNEEALLKICFWADISGNNEASIRLHQQIIDEQPYCELAWFNLAAAYQGLKLYEKAIDAYRFALVIDDRMEIAYRNMGDALIRIRKYKEAIEALEKVVELSRPEDIVYEAIGHCYHKLNLFAQARINYRKAAHINNTDSGIYYKIAVSYYRERKFTQAIKQLEHALKIHKNQVEYNLLMGDCLLELKKVKDAISYYATVVRLKPRSILGQQALINCLLETCHYDEALQQCKIAYQVTKQNPVFLYYSSACLFVMGKTKEALLELENGLIAQPKGFKKMTELAPGILQLSQVLELVNRYLKKSRKNSNNGGNLF